MNWLKLKLRDWVNSAQDIEMNSTRKQQRGLAISTDGETLGTEPMRLTPEQFDKRIRDELAANAIAAKAAGMSAQ